MILLKKQWASSKMFNYPSSSYPCLTVHITAIYLNCLIIGIQWSKNLNAKNGMIIGYKLCLISSFYLVFFGFFNIIFIYNNYTWFIDCWIHFRKYFLTHIWYTFVCIYILYNPVLILLIYIIVVERQTYGREVLWRWTKICDLVSRWYRKCFVS